MASFPSEIWGLIAAIGGLAVVAFLYTLAAQVRDQTAMHDLTRRVHTLHEQYTNRLTAMRARARALEELESLARRGTAGETPPIAPMAADGEYDVVEEPERRAA